MNDLIWNQISEIDWVHPTSNWFNIDTRDFCSSQGVANHPDYKTLSLVSLASKFFLTQDEITALIEHLFRESGGEGEWRYLSLLGQNKDTKYWLLKYIRIFRTPMGFLFCNSENKAIPRKDLIGNDGTIVAQVDKSILNHS